MNLALVFTTISKGKASRLAKRVVEKKLAACGNILDVGSIYWWKGSVRDEGEALILFKTTEDKAAELRDFLEREHPYDVPEIIQVQPGQVNGKYLRWVAQSVAG